MAGFLRKKTKQPEPTTKGLPTVSLSSSGPPPPLFSRFATNGQNSSNVSPRIVSSPMSLASHGRKDLTPKGGVGRGNNNFGASSLAAGSREAEMARRRAQEQAQASQASLNHHSTRPIVDKPLPSPVGNDGPSQPLPTASPAVGRRTISNRGPGPPPTFQTQQHQGMWSRASLDSRDRDTKPLPRPGSAQASYASQERQAPPASYTLTPAVPPKPKVSVSSFNTAVTPQIGPPITNAYRKTQPPLPPSSGQSSDEGFASQAPLPQTSKRTQDFPSDALNGVGGAQSNLRLSQQTLPEIYSTPMSVRALDLPPEFALFQVCKLNFFIPMPATPIIPIVQRYGRRRAKVNLHAQIPTLRENLAPDTHPRGAPSGDVKAFVLAMALAFA